MVKRVTGRQLVSNPDTSGNPRRQTGWVGVPGARHIPRTSDPVFPGFTAIVADWTQAGIEMTDELMAAALQLATTKFQRAEERAAVEARQEQRLKTMAQEAPEPGAYGDAPGGVVYYIRRAQYVKIGTTTQLRGRMLSLMPDEVLAVEPGSYRLEGEMHRRFASLRVRPNLEFFHLQDELRKHIQDVLARVGPPPSGLTITDLLGQAA